MNDSGDVTWRSTAVALQEATAALIGEAAEAGPDDVMDVLEARMAAAQRMRHLCDDLIGWLMLDLLDARAKPEGVAQLMGAVSPQAVQRRAARERQRLQARTAPPSPRQDRAAHRPIDRQLVPGEVTTRPAGPTAASR